MVAHLVKVVGAMGKQVSKFDWTGSKEACLAWMTI